MLRLYRSLTAIGAPLIRLLLRWRERTGKEDATRITERTGIAGLPRPGGRLIWIHAASIGEAMSALPLMQHLLNRQDDLHILISTGTLSSARIISEHLPARAVHQFVPLDHVPWVTKFLDHWRPDVAIWIESELWPNLILETARRGIPMALLNGRMSARSFKRWQLAPRSIKQLLNCFTVLLAHNEQSEAFFQSLGAADAVCVGDLKHTAEILDADPEELSRLITAIGERPAWLAASTHPGEEAVIKEVHARLCAQYPDLLTIIVPRHAPRGEQIKSLLNTGRHGNLSVACRSKGEMPSPQHAIYLADTMGEMGLLYRLTKVVFMGGSMVPHGGQNPLEPARLGCAILYGPHVGNFSDIFEGLTTAGAARKVFDASDLQVAVARLLRDPRTVTARGLAGKAFTVKSGDKVMGRILGAVAPLLPKPD